MSPGILMIIIMTLPSGGVSASFVNVDNREECLSRLSRIRPILEQAEGKLVEAGCFASAARFEPFDHNPPSDAPRFSYRIQIRGEAAGIERLAVPTGCVIVQPAGGNAASADYCATSTQDLVAAQP